MIILMELWVFKKGECKWKLNIHFQKAKGTFALHRKYQGTEKKHHRLPFYWGLTIDDLWWNETLKKWGTFEGFKETKTNYGTHKYCVTSVKSAVRHIRKHDEIPKGTKVRLCSNFVGCDVIITK